MLNSSSALISKFRSGRGVQIAGWLLLFTLTGGVYLLAVPQNSWLWVSVFVGLLFMLVGAGVLWDWVTIRHPVLNARNVIFAGVLFWLLLDPLLMREGLDEFEPALILRALLYAGIFLFAVWAGYLIRPLSRVRKFLTNMPAQTNDNFVFWFAVALYLLGIVPLISVTGGNIPEIWRLLLAGYSPDVEIGWRRGMLGDQYDFFKSITRLFHLTIPFLGIYLIRGRLSIWKKVLLVLMMLSLFLILFFSGERRVLGLVVLGPLLYMFFAATKRARRKSLPALVLLVLILFWVMQAQVQFRSAGFYDFDATAVESNPLEMHRDNNFYWFATAVDTMPSMYNFTNEWIFLQLLTHPIPRFLWLGKPYSVGFPFVHWEETGASLSISVVGELFVSQGLLGIVVGGLLYGWMARNWDEFRKFLNTNNASRLIYALGLTLLLIAVRSFGDLVVNWYVLALVVISLRYLGLRVRPRATFWPVVNADRSELLR